MLVFSPCHKSGGGKEESFKLLACVIENGCDLDACKLRATLHFEFYAEVGDASHYNHQVNRLDSKSFTFVTYTCDQKGILSCYNNLWSNIRFLPISYSCSLFNFNLQGHF
jgi:hypothetical protein